MSLPILPTFASASPETLIRLFHQTERLFSEHFSEPAQLDVGTAFVTPAMATVRKANRVMEVALPAEMSAQQALDEVNTHFASQGSECKSWIMNPSAPPVQTVPIVDHLISLGYTRHATDIQYLHRAPVTKVREVAGLTIIPARASYRHARELASIRSDGSAKDPQAVEASMAALDDPHYESLIALRDGQPIARASVLTMGEVGRIENLLVIPSARRHGIGRTMMSRMLEICARSLFKHIFLSCDADNLAANALYKQLGFQKIGELIDYRPPS
jgi:ribosomal protein S18 acetylase RimI-like enzyme